MRTRFYFTLTDLNMPQIEPYFTSSWFAGKRAHFAVCGSISAYKAIDLLRACAHAGIAATVSMTDAACKFLRPLSFSSLGAEAVYTSMFRPEGGAPGLAGAGDAAHGGAFADIEEFWHLAPGAECDAFAVVPATASTLARIAHGMADEIVCAQALAFPRPILLAPAMNPRMWASAGVKANCATLLERGHVFVCPGYGKVACGEEGQGKLADLREIYLHLLKMLAPQDLSGRKIMLTLGPTREAWDGVRYWSNHSTGVMGASLALAAWLRGAEVSAVCGPASPWLPEAIRRTDVTGAKEMHSAALDLWPEQDAAICTAAVADFSPEPLGPEKFKKDGSTEEFTIKFTLNPDILADLGRNKKNGQLLAGFAAETSRVAENAKAKLERKKADLIIGNLVGQPGSGFASPTNKACAVDRNGREEDWPALPKADVAWRVLSWLSTL